jgi:hypothetical protein
MQTQWKSMKSAHGVSGKALIQLPDNTLLSVLMTNPGQLWQASKQAMLDRQTNARMKTLLEGKLRQFAPMDDILNQCTGECALALTWTPANGFGVEILGETASPEVAQRQAAALTRFLSGLHQPVVALAGGGYQLPLSLGNAEFPTRFCWAGKGAWLKFSTQPAYLTYTEPTHVQCPAEALGADGVCLLDLHNLPALAKHFDSKLGKQNISTVVDKLELAKLQLVSYNTISSDGSTQHAVLEINDWDWKNLLKLASD